ncbi:MAG TPA: recombination mediator RecR [Candidatus Bathyarchaeia archaeon]|nr:recombination mediator RecR [Candidatus Bathyarchaeia archaeon]
MIDELPSLRQLLHALSYVPYFASKNMYRIIDYFMRMNDEQLEQFCATLLKAKKNSMLCAVCFCWKERVSSCVFCSSEKRDQSIICVVETWQELLALEKTKGYTGVYHVLGGAINPLEGKGPDDLTIDALINRIEQKTVKELILAMNQTPEGDATAAFIARKIHHMPVTLSRLARGLPVGSSLDTMDRLTVFKALAERRPF